MAQVKKQDCTTKQEGKPTLKNGNPINEARQFGKPNGNPRHNGAWKKEDTPRYKLEQMLKLDKAELEAILNDDDAPLFERRLARSLLTENDFKTTEAMINQIYGAPKQVQETKLEAEVSGIDVIFKDESQK